MTGIGETLRRERLRRQLDLEQISRETKIAQRMLEAIEAEQFDKLPGGVFTKSFVRQYARVLGLDEDELVEELERTLAPEPEPPLPAEKPPARRIAMPPVAEWESVADGRRSRASWLPSLIMVVVAMLVCSAVYAWWQRSRRVAPAETAAVPQAQTQAAAPAVQPSAAAPATAVTAGPAGEAATATPGSPPPGSTALGQPPAAAPGTTQTAAPAGVPPAGIAPATATPALAATTPPVTVPATAPPPAAAAPSNPNAAVRVHLTALEPTWVRIASDGRYVYSGTLAASQSRTVEADQSVSLRVGNAAGVGVVLNGKPLGTLGPKGQVRDVVLTREGVQIVPRKPPGSAAPAPLTDPL